MKVVAIIPTYNEAQNVRILIPRILGLGPEFHCRVVDDSSPDGTAEVVRELQKADARVSILVRPGKMGLGSAYIAGFKEALKAGADFIIEIDADHSHDYKDIPRFLDEMSSSDLVIGSRYKKGISVIDWPLSRVLLSYFGNSYAFQIEMNFRAAAKGFRLSEIPIIFWGRYSGESKMSGHIVREAVLIVWRLRFLKIFSKLGLAKI